MVDLRRFPHTAEDRRKETTMKKEHTKLKEAALKYHSEGRPGKLEVIPIKPFGSQRDLSLAYSPGVAYPCLEIEKNPEDAYKYTSKTNLVAVISNGTAVLGLGDIGALAGKPVMEGKGLLFKTFADIDVFDIEVDTSLPPSAASTWRISKPRSVSSSKSGCAANSTSP